jgi:signal transduction histidine kinase
MQHNFEILNSFADSIAVIDSEGRIIFINSAWQNFSDQNGGTNDRTGAGCNYLTVCNGEAEEAGAAAAKGLKQVMNRELDIFELEYPCHSPNIKRWFLLRGTAIAGSDLTLVSHLNITRRRLAELHSLEANKTLQNTVERLDSTLLKIVHDIQGPLNAIEGLTMLEKGEGDPGTSYSGMMRKAVLNLKNYIGETLQLLRQSPSSEPVDFRKLASGIIESIVEPQAIATIKMEIDINQEEKFYSNRLELQSILTNILTNSIKYIDRTKQEPRILLKIDVQPGKALITISDNGIGIQKDVLPYIFDHSYQVTKAMGGAGIGLFMVRRSVEMLNGKIEVRSVFGELTEFHIEIPGASSSI